MCKAMGMSEKATSAITAIVKVVVIAAVCALLCASGGFMGLTMIFPQMLQESGIIQDTVMIFSRNKWRQKSRPWRIGCDRNGFHCYFDVHSYPWS